VHKHVRNAEGNYLVPHITPSIRTSIAGFRANVVC